MGYFPANFSSLINRKVIKCTYFIYLAMEPRKLYLNRSSDPEKFLEKGVLKICSKFIEEHPC